MDVSELFSIPTTRCSRAICFLNSSYFFNASIVTFSEKKNFWKKKRLPSTLDMEPSPSTWNPRPSTLDKKIDSLLSYHCKADMNPSEAKHSKQQKKNKEMKSID